MAKKTDSNRVEIMVPRESGNNEPNLFVGVNGVNYILPRGKKSLVPPAVAAEFERSKAAQDRMYEEQDALLQQAK